MKKSLFLAFAILIAGQTTSIYPMINIWQYLKNSAYKAWNYTAKITNPIFNSSKTALTLGLQHKNKLAFSMGAFMSTYLIYNYPLYNSQATLDFLNQPLYVANKKTTAKINQALKKFTLYITEGEGDGNWGSGVSFPEFTIKAYDKFGIYAGHAICGINMHMKGFIHDLIVKDAYQRQGLGCLLGFMAINHIIKTSQQRYHNKVKTVGLIAAPFKRNLSIDELIKFYENLGGKVVKRSTTDNLASMQIDLGTGKTISLKP